MNRTNCQNIVWDWNGTLLDDVQTGVDTLADMLCRRGITPLTVEEYKQTFCFPVIDFYRQTGFDLDKESMHDLSTDFVESYEKHAGSLTLVQDVPEVLAALHATGKRLYILSALREEELLRMTREYGIDSYFEKICGSDNIYANGKIDRGPPAGVGLRHPPGRDPHGRRHPARCRSGAGARFSMRPVCRRSQ